MFHCLFVQANLNPMEGGSKPINVTRIFIETCTFKYRNWNILILTFYIFFLLLNFQTIKNDKSNIIYYFSLCVLIWYWTQSGSRRCFDISRTDRLIPRIYGTSTYAFTLIRIQFSQKLTLCFNFSNRLIFWID